MFAGIRRGKATRAAIQAVQPLLACVTHFQTVKDETWSDPYILGYINMVIAQFSNAAAKGKLTREDNGHVTIEAYRHIFPPHLQEWLRQITIDYVLSENPEYFRGMEAAGKSIAVTYGMPVTDDDPDMLLAKIYAGEGANAGQLGGAMQTLLFAEPFNRINNGDDSA